jgi:hypothetical protein
VEKRTPHCKLAVVKALVAAGKVRSTVSALAGGASLGLDFAGIVGVVKALTPPGAWPARPPPPHASGRRLPETYGH